MKKPTKTTIPAVTTSEPSAPAQPVAFPARQKQQTAKEVIAANVQLLIEQLEAGHSERLTAYLSGMGRFHSYSFGNILEIARQRPEATRVAGLYAWNQLGRRVKKGEHGIRILAPMIGTWRKPDAERGDRPGPGLWCNALLIFFRESFARRRLVRRKEEPLKTLAAQGQQSDGPALAAHL